MTIGLASLKVEFAFGFRPIVDLTPTWTDVTAYVQTIQTSRGRDPVLGSFPSGSATVVLRNQDYRFDPDNGSSPYAGDLLPVVPVRISANDSTSTQKWLFYGYVKPRDGWQQNYTATTATTTVNCVDFLAILATIALPGPLTATGGTLVWDAALQQFVLFAQRLHSIVGFSTPDPTHQGLTTGALVSALITDGLLPSPVPGWSVGTCVFHTPGYLGAANALSYVQNLAATEGGALYVTSAGVVNFDGRTEVITNSRMTASQATFDDSGAGVSFSTDGFSKTYAHEIVNSVTITPANGNPVTKADATSVASYTQTDFSFTGAYETAADALAQADFIVKQYKDPVSCPSTIRLKMQRSSSVLDAGLHRELRDRVTVKRKPPGAAAQVTSSVFVEKIVHTIDTRAQSWDCDLTFSTAQTVAYVEGKSYFTLGSSLLGGGDVLGF